MDDPAVSQVAGKLAFRLTAFLTSTPISRLVLLYYCITVLLDCNLYDWKLLVQVAEDLDRTIGSDTVCLSFCACSEFAEIEGESSRGLA